MGWCCSVVRGGVVEGGVVGVVLWSGVVGCCSRKFVLKVGVVGMCVENSSEKKLNIKSGNTRRK